MTPPKPVVRSAAYVAGTTGSRFRMVTEPSNAEVRGTIVLAQAFAEEMNKTRRMCARMSHLLAGDGWRVVQRDLCGCGDSSGEFRDASWPAWIDDLDAELSLADERKPLWLWCVRAGALLAPALLARRPRVNLLLWQPVTSGAQHLQQFLRLHAGARIVGSSKSSDQQTPAQKLKAGATVEVGGYELSPALATGLEQAVFDTPAGFTGRVVWFELSTDLGPAASPAATRMAERLLARQVDVEIEALNGPLFWQTQEIEESEALLERTRIRLDAAAAGARSAAARDACHG